MPARSTSAAVVVTQKLKETRLSNARALAAMLQPNLSDGCGDMDQCANNQDCRGECYQLYFPFFAG
jgi:hypothetical protein